jgi:transcriptional regulator with XRE-family HTH domain
MHREPTGVPDLDELLAGGVIGGDNVVWTGDSRATLRRLADAFVGVAAARSVWVRTSDRRGDGQAPPPAVEVLDARPRRPLADPIALEAALMETVTPGSRVVVDGVDALVRRWGGERATTTFTRLCPRLFDVGATAYWLGDHRAVGAEFVDAARRITQCLFEVREGTLRIVKAEGHPSRLEGMQVVLEHDGDEIRLGRELVLGRVGAGLRRLRAERNLSQTDLARLAGVTPSAISQAEAGRRGLSLDTLVALCERTGVGLDDLLGRERVGDYVLARRDRTTANLGMTALLDDPGTGLRAYLVRLGPGEDGAPATRHKGTELVLVAQGLVTIDLGDTSPVLRAGDAILAMRSPIIGWRNLAPEPARLFWIVRD